MDEKDNKFIIGDNTDGYRRSGKNDATQEFSLPPAKPRRQRPTQPQTGRTGSNQPPVRRSPAPTKASKKPIGRSPAQKSKAANPNGRGSAQQSRQKLPSSGRPQQRRTSAGGQASMSQNERRRQHNEIRRRQRKIKQLLTYAAIAVMILIVAVILSLTVFFRVNKIEIVGKTPYTAKQITAACGIAIGENVIRCDVDSVSGRLSSALPYIGKATVKRSLSGKIVITVTATSGKYSFLNGEQCVVIDALGKVLEITSPDKAIEYTMILGVVPTECKPGQTAKFSDSKALGMVCQLGNGMSSASISSITSIDISDVDYIQAVYDGRITMVIGSTSGLSRKLALAERVIGRENEIDPMQYGRIDLTIDGKAYFRPDEEGTDSQEDGGESSSKETNDAA